MEIISIGEISISIVLQCSNNENLNLPHSFIFGSWLFAFFRDNIIAIRCILERTHKGIRRYIEKKLLSVFDASLLLLIMSFILTRVHSVQVMTELFDVAFKLLLHIDM